MFEDSLIKDLIKKHERVKFKHKSKKEEPYELGVEFDEESISHAKPSSYSEKIYYYDECCAGPDVKLKKKLDLDRIMKESHPDIWDEE